MFHLPINTIKNNLKTDSFSEALRESRGYQYMIFKFKTDSNTGTGVEEYTVLTDEQRCKILAYMAPRQTGEFRIDAPYNELNQHIEVKESIEGTMVTFFWNGDTNEWNICTRNGVGCDYSYARPLNPSDVMRPKTFRQMVIDVFQPLALINEPDFFEELNDISILNNLSKSYCYTCILQHPDNHIVYSGPSFEPTLHLISIYELNAMPPLISVDSDEFVDGCVRELENTYRNQEYLRGSKTDEDANIWETALKVFGEHPISTKYLRSSEELQAFNNDILEKQNESSSFANIDPESIEFGSDSKFFPPAWILTNVETGHSCEIQNPFYEKAKKLRSFQPNIRFQYLDLRGNGLVEQYLHTFPRYEEPFQILETEYNDFITEVYGAYVKFYIMNIRDGSIPKNRFIHAAKIHHEVYLTQTPRRRITIQDVEYYFAAVKPAKMFYYLTTD